MFSLAILNNLNLLQLLKFLWFLWVFKKNLIWLDLNVKLNKIVLTGELEGNEID